MKRLNLLNKKFGKLKVLAFSHIDTTGNSCWKCQCKCGNIKVIASRHLRKDRTKSCGCLSKLPKGEAAFNVLYRNYKRKAEQRNLNFKLDKKEFKKLTKQKCHYCGAAPAQSAIKWGRGRNGDYLFNGIDRKDNKLGYTNKNCVTCCKICNRAKWNMNYSEFLSWINNLRGNTNVPQE